VTTNPGGEYTLSQVPFGTFDLSAFDLQTGGSGSAAGVVFGVAGEHVVQDIVLNRPPAGP
jgi:hypothetical protein